jgi:predicted HicB family RNase H-like nuclease
LPIIGSWCKERGNESEKPYSGTLSLRIAPELHRRVAEQAAKAGESINQFIAERLEEVA